MRITEGKPLTRDWKRAGGRSRISNLPTRATALPCCRSVSSCSSRMPSPPPQQQRPPPRSKPTPHARSGCALAVTERWSSCNGSPPLTFVIGHHRSSLQLRHDFEYDGFTSRTHHVPQRGCPHRASAAHPLTSLDAHRQTCCHCTPLAPPFCLPHTPPVLPFNIENPYSGTFLPASFKSQYLKRFGPVAFTTSPVYLAESLQILT